MAAEKEELKRAKTRAYIDTAIFSVFWFYLIVVTDAEAGILLATVFIVTWRAVISLPIRRVDAMEDQMRREQQEELAERNKQGMETEKIARQLAQKKKEEEIYRTLRSKWQLAVLDDFQTKEKGEW